MTLVEAVGTPILTRVFHLRHMVAGDVNDAFSDAVISFLIRIRRKKGGAKAAKL